MSRQTMLCRALRRTLAVTLLPAALLAAGAGMAAAQSPAHCTCAGLGVVALVPDDAGAAGSGVGSGPDPLPYAPAAGSGDATIHARFTFQCTESAGGGTRCDAQVDATVEWSGGSSIASGSASRTAPAATCLVLSQALQSAWLQALGDRHRNAAPIPCA